MRNDLDIRQGIDWISVFLYLALLAFGWANVYAADFNPEQINQSFDWDGHAGRQLIFIGGAFILVIIILFLDYKFYDSFAPIFYVLIILLMLVTLVIAPNIKGSRSWLRLGGGFNLQPAEFAKFVTALMLARYMSNPTINLKRLRDILPALGIIVLPAMLTIAQKEVGVSLTYAAFFIMLYREGMNGIFLVLAIAGAILGISTIAFGATWVSIGLICLLLLTFWLFIPRYNRNKKTALSFLWIFLICGAFSFSVDLVFDKLPKHHQNRLRILTNPNIDPLGIGWNTTQSKIAISSGGIVGKGYMQGTQTKGDFVPEQHTDFIFCTVGEEWGFLGSLVVITLFLALLNRLISLAEKQRSRFNRVYGYCVASIVFFHLLVNIGMTIGLMPVIGIPLPYFSYGGTSVWSFSILLFIFLKLDAHRTSRA